MPTQRTDPWTHATRITARLVCWSLGAALLLNAVQGLAHPALPGFRQLWLGMWVLTGGLMVGWAALRAVEKSATADDGAAPTSLDAEPPQEPQADAAH